VWTCSACGQHGDDRDDIACPTCPARTGGGHLPTFTTAGETWTPEWVTDIATADTEPPPADESYEDDYDAIDEQDRAAEMAADCEVDL